jgi:hypothetical protein
MAITPVFCCGFEEGIATGSTGHWTLTNATIQSVTKRTGTYALKCNPSNTQHYAYGYGTLDSFYFVSRVYVTFTTLPNAKVPISANSLTAGAWFNPADSKIYASDAAGNLGATGVAVAQGGTYRIEVKVNSSANPWTIDVSVDGSDCGQKTVALGATIIIYILLGNYGVNCTGEWYYDDVIASITLADYPIGAGSVLGFVPTSDPAGGQVAIATHWHVGTTATTLANGATTCWTYIDDVPLPSGAVTDDSLNNAHDDDGASYIEVLLACAAATIAPRGVEAITVAHQVGSNPCNLTVKLNDGGTVATVKAWSTPGAAYVYARAHFATAPSGGAWTLAKLQALRARIGYSTDVNPDIFCDALMIEAEFAEPVVFVPSRNYYPHILAH